MCPVFCIMVTCRVKCTVKLPVISPELEMYLTFYCTFLNGIGYVGASCHLFTLSVVQYSRGIDSGMVPTPPWPLLLVCTFAYRSYSHQRRPQLQR